MCPIIPEEEGRELVSLRHDQGPGPQVHLVQRGAAVEVPEHCAEGTAGDTGKGVKEFALPDGEADIVGPVFLHEPEDRGDAEGGIEGMVMLHHHHILRLCCLQPLNT